MEQDTKYRWYQRPPDGNHTALGLGRPRVEFADEIFPENLHNKTLLDVGCAEGVFCAEAIKRGAARVVGIDKKERRIAMASQVQQSQGSNVEFMSGNFEEMRQEDVGQFDYVICLNVIHHAINPIGFIQKLAAITRNKLILEVAGLAELEAKTSLGIWRYFFSIIPLKFQPSIIIHGANSGFCLSPKAVAQAVQTGGANSFRSIDVRPSYSSQKKTRYCLIASK